MCVAQNKASVAYYLMFDNQMRMKSGAYLREELSEASDAMMQHPSGAAARTPILPVPRAAGSGALGARCLRAPDSHVCQNPPSCPISLLYCGL